MVQCDTEWGPFADQLRSEGLFRYRIPADGDCLFAAIADQLEHLRPGSSYDKAEVRQQIVYYILEHGDEFWMITVPEPGQQVETLAQYCARMRHAGSRYDLRTWGGEFEIFAATSRFQCHIATHTPGRDTIIHEYADADAHTITLHLAHIGNCHYDSCRRISGPVSAEVPTAPVKSSAQGSDTEDDAVFVDCV